MERQRRVVLIWRGEKQLCRIRVQEDVLREEKDALFRELKTYQKIQKNIETVLDDKNENSVLEALEKKQVEVKQREVEKPRKRNRGMEL